MSTPSWLDEVVAWATGKAAAKELPARRQFRTQVPAQIPTVDGGSVQVAVLTVNVDVLIDSIGTIRVRYAGANIGQRLGAAIPWIKIGSVQ